MSHANFVATEWLDAHLGDPDLRVIDASWHLPTTARKGDAEFLAGHIPGAVFFNIDTIADTSTNLPHMLPKPDAFAKAMGESIIRFATANARNGRWFDPIAAERLRNRGVFVAAWLAERQCARSKTRKSRAYCAASSGSRCQSIAT